jgi:hypothetical protein
MSPIFDEEPILSGATTDLSHFTELAPVSFNLAQCAVNSLGKFCSLEIHLHVTRHGDLTEICLESAIQSH